MHPHRRRKKRPNYGIRTVEVERGPNGFGFTISGQQPCILSCIVANSPADQAGLRAGDFLISVNGLSVSKIAHDSVVQLIGTSIGPIKMSIAEYYYSDSSDEDVDSSRIGNSRKPKYMHKPRMHHRKHEFVDVMLKKETAPKKSVRIVEYKKPVADDQVFDDNSVETSPNVTINEPEINPIEYKSLVGYLGTIEMPKQLLPNSRLHTVCSCIRKLRHEKRTPSAVLMTVLPSCLTLKNSNSQILAIFPASRIVYISASSDKDPRYFGLVTSAICENHNLNAKYMWENNIPLDKQPTNSEEVEISNSCHVFMTDPKLVDHNIHVKNADSFKFKCTSDIITGHCLEFSKSAIYVVSLVQNMYRLQDTQIDLKRNLDDPQLVANSPQPSASSNSDSGIGFRDDFGNISDRILIVEFPSQRLPPIIAGPNLRPVAINGSTIPLDNFDLSNDTSPYSISNIRAKSNFPAKRFEENIDKSKLTQTYRDDLLNNIRACDVTKIPDADITFVKPSIPSSESKTKIKEWTNRLTVRAMPDPVRATPSEESYRNADVDTGQIFSERGVDVPYDTSVISDELKTSIDNISVHSSKSMDLKSVFKTPKCFDYKLKIERATKVNSFDNLTPGGSDDQCLNYKLSPKVYGVAKPNHSCEELNNLDSSDKCGFGSLQDLSSWIVEDGNRRTVAVSEPDVRLQRDGSSGLGEMCEDAPKQTTTSGGAASWAASFEKLLDDPLGVQIFAEFLKKEFSAENIYFWTACERFRRQPVVAERTAEAQRIYRRHLCVGASDPVNVDSQGRQYTQQSLQDAEPKTFEPAQKQIFNLMKFDSYPRFLKSEVYNQCLSGSIEIPQIEVGLLIHPLNNTPSKLKKSLSNAEDRRRKSLLPWHRKNRSKSKDRGETDYNNQHRDEPVAPTPAKSCTITNAHSSQSSLTSLDLAMSCSMQDCASSKGSHDDMAPCNLDGKGVLCRVFLNDGATTVVQIRSNETVRQLANRLLDKRGLNYSAYEVHVAKHPKAIDLNEASTTLAGCEVIIEQRVVFKLDLPNRKVISVKSKATKVLLDVLRPILRRYGYGLEEVHVSLVGNTSEFVDVTLPVTSIDNRRLNITHIDVTKATVPAPSIQKQKSLDEITNTVFEQLLNEKSDNNNEQTYDRGSVKSEDWGSEHSSGIIGRFLRRDSAMHERKKKVIRIKGNSSHSSVEDITGEPIIRKPLIAKWKAGVKLQVACSESDELYEGLKRAQRCRLEDQRGTEINFELPDFLKDKENAQSNIKLRKLQQNGVQTGTARFYDDLPKNLPDNTPVTTANLKLDLKTSEQHQNTVGNIRVTSPSVTSIEDTSRSSVNKAKMVEPLLDLSPKVVEPPPLPPKPKVLPIKPSNWGQSNSYFKIPRDVTPKPSDRSKHTLYLEQPTSSFV